MNIDFKSLPFIPMPLKQINEERIPSQEDETVLSVKEMQEKIQLSIDEKLSKKK